MHRLDDNDYGVRTDRYKLIHFEGDLDVWELYDLDTDPHELRNRYGDPALRAVQQSLHEKLDDLQRELKDDTGKLDPSRETPSH